MAWPLCSRLAEHAPFRQGREGHLTRTVGWPYQAPEKEKATWAKKMPGSRRFSMA